MWQLHEAHAKEHSRQLLAEAAEHRLARQVASVRRWRRVASFASNRLERASVRVAEAHPRPSVVLPR